MQRRLGCRWDRRRGRRIYSAQYREALVRLYDVWKRKKLGAGRLLGREGLSRYTVWSWRGLVEQPVRLTIGGEGSPQPAGTFTTVSEALTGDPATTFVCLLRILGKMRAVDFKS
jgi:hypothetical protein